MEGEKICNITVWPDCKNVSGFHSAARFSNASFVEVVIDGVTLEKIEKFCFLLNGSNGTKIVHVGGEHRISGKFMPLNFSIISFFFYCRNNILLSNSFTHQNNFIFSYSMYNNTERVTVV